MKNAFKEEAIIIYLLNLSKNNHSKGRIYYGELLLKADLNF